MPYVVHVVAIHGQLKMFDTMPRMLFYQDIMRGVLTGSYQYTVLTPQSTRQFEARSEEEEPYKVTITVNEAEAKLSVSDPAPAVFRLVEIEQLLFFEDDAAREISLTKDISLSIPQGNNTKIEYFLVYGPPAPNIAAVIENMINHYLND